MDMYKLTLIVLKEYYILIEYIFYYYFLYSLINLYTLNI